MKQHDEVTDEPRVRVDRPWRPPFKPLPDLPARIRAADLMTLPVQPEPARSFQRAEWVRKKVEKMCIAGDDPEIHVVHPPHMLEVIETTTSASGTATPVLENQRETDIKELKPTIKRRKRKNIFGTKSKYVAKKSKLSTVYTHTSPQPVDRCYVEIPWVRPYRRPGEPVVVYHLPDVVDAPNIGTEKDRIEENDMLLPEEIEEQDEMEELAVTQELEEEEEEIEEFEDERFDDAGGDDFPSPPILDASPVRRRNEPLVFPHEEPLDESSPPEDFYSVVSEAT
jgi:hypothetical protein